ncbi:hypothetical protein [Burkholderia gladioli]|uniref:hypothetical protein n=1 Tax=Burkholderia gladioli TaxID=28095 RepID=UPI0016406987|nr:hypothetical protein [Burkholderia gladioli]
MLDDVTRHPVSGYAYIVRAANGRVGQGKTDANGFANWFDDHDAVPLTFEHPGRMFK